MAVSIFSCPECSSTLRSAQEIAAGTKIKCPKCGAIFVVPERGGAAPASQGSKLEGNWEKKPAAKQPPPRRPAPAEDIAMYDDDDDDKAQEKVRPRKKKFKGKKKKKSRLAINPGVVVAVVLVALLFGGLGFAAYYFLRPLGTEPLAFVPANSTEVVTTDIEALVDAGLGTDVEETLKQTLILPVRINLANCKKETDLEFKELFNQLTFATTEPIKMLEFNTKPNSKFVLVIKSKVSFDRAKVLKLFGVPDSEDITSSRKAVYKQKNASNPNTLYIPSDRIIIITNLVDKDQEPILASGGRKPALSPGAMNLVETVRRQGQLWYVAPFVEKTGQDVQNQLQSAGSVGRDMKAVQAALPNAKGLGGWVKIEGGQLKVNVALIGADEAAAGTVKDDVQKTWTKYTRGVSGALLVSAFLSQMPEPVRLVIQEVMKSVNFRTEGAMAIASLQVSVQSYKNLKQELKNLAAGGFGRPGK